MIIKDSEFVISSSDVSGCPAIDKPEYAFIGRSNVGKSSLINMLTKRKKLAKISSAPGKTMLINHFLINKEWYLVDLPGYGYAKRSKMERSKWEKMIRKYILTRENLLSLFLLIDLRHEPQKNDLEFIEWLGVSQIPMVLVFTKSDKLKRKEIEKNFHDYRKRLQETWEELPEMIITSSEDGTGRDDVLAYVEKTNRVFK